MLVFIRGLREKGPSLDNAIQTGALTRLRSVPRCPGADDGLGRIDRISADGARHWHRRGSATAAGHGGDRRDSIVDGWWRCRCYTRMVHGREQMVVKVLILAVDSING